jgi:hypothetical protein
MFGMQKCGSFLTVGINLVVCSAIVYYFHKRLSSLENALLKQNQVFSSFMAEMVNKTRQGQQGQGQGQQGQGQQGQGQVQSVELAAPEAIAAASKFVTMQKIEVSDDELSEDSETSGSEEEDESDEESASDGEEDVKKIKLSNIDITEGGNNTQHLDLNTLSEEMLISSMANNFMMMQSQDSMNGSFVFINGRAMMMNPNEPSSEFSMPVFEEITDLEETKKVIILNDSSSDSDADSESDDEQIITVLKKTSSTPPRSPILLQVETLHDVEGQEEPVKIIKSEDFADITTTTLPKKATKKNIVVMDMETGSFNQTTPDAAASAAAAAAEKLENMKIDDLRKNAVLKNLAGKEEVKKMKKPELIALLKK